MLRRKAAAGTPSGAILTKTECEGLAEDFVDRLLDPFAPWFRQYLLAYAPYSKASKPLFQALGFASDLIGSRFEKGFCDALEEMDRPRMVALLTKQFIKDPIPKEQASAIFQMFEPSLWKQALRNSGSMFQIKRGAKPKIPRRDYAKLAAWGDKLVPVIGKLLGELESGTRHSPESLLEFWKKDYPQACIFLLHHLSRFRLALKDQGLRKRAQGIVARSRVLADALAGSDYKLRFSTSVQRASEGRRQREYTSD